jgi:uncharacterized protein YlxW (UPF0749 family)
MTAGRTSPTQALVEFVLDPRDPGYQQAAARRGGAPRAPGADRWLTALGCLVIGFALAIAWVHTHRSAPQAAKVHDELVQRVRTAASAADALTGRAAALEARLSRLRARALGDNGALRQRLQRDQLAAGELAVTGPGLEVSLAEPAESAAPSAAPTEPARPTGIATILTDRDVRSVVNQLWSDGAEAIAVNGIRLTPLSAIRFAGQAVLVDREPITSPYVIDAIGDGDSLDTGFAASDVASRYQTLQTAAGVRFSFAEQSVLHLPAAAPAPLHYASAGSGR